MPRITLPGPVGEFAASHHGAFSRRQAATFGLNKYAIGQLIAYGSLREPAPGVLVDTRHPDGWHQRLAVATLACNCAGVAAFESAAQLHGIDGRWGDRIVLLAAAPRRLRLDSATLHVGPLEPCDVTVVDGIVCTTVERTLSDLGSVAADLSTRIAFEWYWRTHGALSELQAVVDRLHRPGQHGTRAMQELLVESRLKGTPTESALEVRLDAILAEIPGLVRQFEVLRADGSFVARVDFAVPSLRLAIEAHSRQFHAGQEAHRRDEDRHERLCSEDWRVRYVTNAEMDDPCKLRSSIRALMESDESPALPHFDSLAARPSHGT